MVSLQLEGRTHDLANRSVIKRHEFKQLESAQEVLDQIEGLMIDAKSEVASALKNAGTEGYKAGEEKARLEYAERLLKLAAEEQTLLDRIKPQVAGIVKRALNLVLGTAPQEDLLVSCVGQSISEVQGEKSLRLEVHPSLHKKFESKLQKWQALNPALQGIQLSSSSQVSPEDCLIRSDVGTMKVNVMEKLNAVAGILQSQAGGQAPPQEANPSTAPMPSPPESTSQSPIDPTQAI